MLNIVTTFYLIHSARHPYECLLGARDFSWDSGGMQGCTHPDFSKKEMYPTNRMHGFNLKVTFQLNDKQA